MEDLTSNMMDLDVDGDGMIDTHVETYDQNGDGIFETTITSEDTDGDGIIDAMTTELDTNADGIVDEQQILIDSDGDGEADIEILKIDGDYDGVFEDMKASQDSDGDGNPETVAWGHDYNQDGEIDSVSTYHDSDGDGSYDTVEKMYDSDNDGKIDTLEVFEDNDGDGKADYHDTVELEIPEAEPQPLSYYPYEGEVESTGLPQFDPSSVTDPELISGSPEESIEYWEFQGDTQRCALYSQKFVIEEFTGEDIDIEEFVDEAKDHGWFSDSGTPIMNINRMLDYYGIDNEMSFHNDISDIEQCLDEGGRVIVSIDANETWYGADDDVFAPDSAINHAVEVIGIDRSDPENPMVILNDSGTPNGQGEMVALDVFEGAWQDGDNQMVACYPA